MTDIAVLGSANLDISVHVDELPVRGATVTGSRVVRAAGGKGLNQAVAAARAGAEVAFSGAVGDDDAGVELLRTLEDAGVRTVVERRDDVPTGTAYITVDRDGHNTIVLHPGANHAAIELSEEQRACIAGAAVLVLQLEVPIGLVTAAATFAHDRGVRVVLTPAPAQPLPPELRAAVDILVPNEGEALAITGASDLDGALAVLHDQGLDVLVTQGADGVTWAPRHGAVERYPAFAVDAVDTTGAGDTFVGVFVASLSAGMPHGDAVRRASAAAALSVQRLGAAVSMPTAAEIDAFLATAPPPRPGSR